MRLEKLQLDNNVIEKIENLGHLVHLKWLDLSFNNIKKIEGLESLVNLADLSLYNNHVSFLDGLFVGPPPFSPKMPVTKKGLGKTAKLPGRFSDARLL